MRARSLFLVAAVACAVTQACSLDTAATGSGPGTGVDAGADAATRDGQADAAGTAGTAGAAGTGGVAGSGGMAGASGAGGSAGLGGAGGTGGVSPTLCVDCPAHQCGVNEACTLLVASGGQGGSDAGAAGSGGQGGSDAGIAGSGGQGGSDAGIAGSGGQGGTDAGAAGADAGAVDASLDGADAALVDASLDGADAALVDASLDGADAAIDSGSAGGSGGQGGTDAGGASRAVCLPRCNLASPSCPAGFTCRSLGGVTPVCYPNDPTQCTARQPDGTSCSQDRQCSSRHCENGHCCTSGVCCSLSADCPGSTVTCTNPSTCQGTRSGAICRSHQCVSGSEPDDSACNTSVSVSKPCGKYKNATCSGTINQTGLTCQTRCTNDAACVAPATCNLGHCCAPGTFDFDSDPATCECVGTPPAGQGTSCSGAIDLGNVADSGQSLTASANLLPDRDVWYRFHAVDSADTSCDNYYVRVRFLTNPGSGYQFRVFRGTCSSAECSGTELTDYDWETDMRKMVNGRFAGQCPCTTPGASPVQDVSVCEDDSADYFVEVNIKAGYTPTSCDEYKLEISNGLYSTP